MYWEGPQLYRPNERPFALHRNGYAGMQRYGAFLWSGDVYSTWETLKTHVPVAVNTGLSGIPFWGTDIGGFVPTPEYTGELHVRWFQFGAFCPSFRAHGRTWHLRLPWGWNTGELGPEELRNYTGGAGHPDRSELHNPHVEPILRKYLELRYRLLPYNYTIAQRVLRDRPADDARAVAALPRRSGGRRPAATSTSGAATCSSRPSSRRARRRGASICRAAPGSTSGPKSALEGGREIERAWIWRRCRCTFAPAPSCRTAPVKQYVDQPVAEPTDARRLSGRRRRVHAVRRRWQDVRLSQGRVHADRR